MRIRRGVNKDPVGHSPIAGGGLVCQVGLTAEVGGKWKLPSPDVTIQDPGSNLLIFGGVDETEVWGIAGGEFDV